MGFAKTKKMFYIKRKIRPCTNTCLGRHDPHLGMHPAKMQTSRGQVRSMYVYDWILDTTKKVKFIIFRR